MYSGSVYVLSGEEHTLPFGEIRALNKTYDSGSNVEKLGDRVVSSSLSDAGLIRIVTQRAAYCRFGGIFVSRSQELLCLADDLSIHVGWGKEKSFAVNSFSLTMEQCGSLGAILKSKLDLKVSLENPDYVFQVESISRGEFILAYSDQGFKKEKWRVRRPRARRFFLPSAIYPKLARALVNLSRAKEGEVFVDPFCGTASLLIESSLMGMRSIGQEITRWIARGASMNMKGFGLPFESVIRGDSCAPYLPLREVDGISTDVPYGRASSTKGLGTEQIIRLFLSAARNSLHSDFYRKRYCVVMHPSTIDLVKLLEEQGNSFQLVEQHLLYVHRNLTRAISVLERIPEG